MHILMDMDGVLIKSSYQDENGNKKFYWHDGFEKDLGISLDTLPRLFGPKWQAAVTGKCTLEETVTEYLEKISPNTPCQDFINYWNENNALLNHDIIPLVEEFVKKGHHLYVASNQEISRFEYVIDRYGSFFTLFDNFFISGRMGVKKPDHEFFNKIISDLQTDAYNILLVDDSINNIKTAESLGIQTFYFDINEAGAIDNLKKAVK